VSNLFFPSSLQQFSNELLPRLMEKTKKLYDLSTLIECHSTTVSFDMWMSKAGHDIFALVIYFLEDD
jgi:hypothetical protein